MTFLASLILFSVGAGDEAAASVIRSQAEAVGKIKTIHWKMETWVGPLEDGRKSAFAEWRKSGVLECWQDGSRQKEVQRTYILWTPDGHRTYPEGQVAISSLNDKESRTLTGWDPDNRPPWPLEFALRGTQFSRGQATISSGAAAKFISGLYDVALHPLAKLVEVCDVAFLGPNDAGTIEFEVKSSKDGKKGEIFVGLKFEIDPAHGFHWKKQRWKNGNWSEVEEFFQPAAGIWLPKRLRAESGDHTVKATIECEVNEPIAESDLALDFPEGTPVEEWKLIPHDAKSEIGQSTYHLWGQGGPARTFNTRAELTSAQFKTTCIKFGGILAAAAVLLMALVWIKRRLWARKLRAA